MQQRYIQSGCGDLFVRELGQGGKHPLLLVHGGPDWDHSYLLPAAQLIARERRVVLFDLRGCGRSAHCQDLADYSVNAASQDVLMIARAMGGPVHVLGFSFGGRLAVAAAQANPAAFASLTLASSTFGGAVTWENEPAERVKRRANIQTFADAFAKDVPCSAALTRKLALEGLPLDVWDKGKIPKIRQVIAEVRFSAEWCKAWKAGLLDGGGKSCLEWLGDTSLPMFILHAEHDYRFPVDGFQSAREMSHIRTQIIRGAGHLVPLEQPERWARVLLDFLAGVESMYL